MVQLTGGPASDGDIAIKGPGLKLNCDVRRFWKCPVCERTLRLAASQTSVECHCQGRRKWMLLVEPAPLHPGVAPLPQPGSRPAVKVEESSTPSARDSVGDDSGSPAAGTESLSTAERPAETGSRSPESESGDKPRKRHDKRRRRPRRSDKRRSKGGNSSEGGNSDTGGGKSGPSAGGGGPQS